MRTLVFSIVLYKSCSVANFKYSKPLVLENYVRIVAIALDLQRVSIYAAIEFLCYGSTIELLLFLILMIRFHLSFKALLIY
jgi:hypothetical protein